MAAPARGRKSAMTRGEKTRGIFDAVQEKPRKLSGRNIGESERNTVAIKLRLDEEDAAMLRGYAVAWGCSLSEVVSTLLRGSPT